MITIDLGTIEPMAALPFHPSEAYTIRELTENPGDILREVEKRAAEQFGGKAVLSLTDKLVDGKLMVDQGVIAGCAGGMYDNIAEAAAILDGHDVGSGYFSLSIYPPSVPVNLELIQNGVQQSLLEAGALFKPCFCGPCFGAGDVPANNGLSIRHTTRNFPNREGSKPGQGQISLVALMDARSIAATAANGGVITAATDVDYTNEHKPYEFDAKIYERRVFNGYGKENLSTELRYGPNIKDWPTMYPMQDNMLLELAAVIHDPVTTTDELIPSGETSSYRSNPLKLSEFALSRRVPEYVGLSKRIQKDDLARRAGKPTAKMKEVLARVGAVAESTSFGSCVFANKPGDGSAREQAASCQKVLGGDANICYEYATKRYRSNCINWGIVPFTIDPETKFDYKAGDFVFVPDIRKSILQGLEECDALVVTADGKVEDIHLYFRNLTPTERQILADGCLMNYYANQNK
jgi:aconitate hydratase